MAVALLTAVWFAMDVAPPLVAEDAPKEPAEAKWTPERIAAFRYYDPHEDDELYLAKRIFFDEATYEPGRIATKLTLRWTHKGKPISGIRVDLAVLGRGERKYQPMDKLSAKGVTDAKGKLDISVSLVPVDCFAPGQYQVSASIDLPSQAKEVREKMLEADDLYAPKLTAEQRAKLRKQLETGEVKLHGALGKFYIAESGYWFDDGILAMAAQARQLENAIAAHKAKYGDEILYGIDGTRRDLELAGGPLSGAEKNLTLACEQKRDALKIEIETFYRERLAQLFDVVEIDVEVWRWYTGELYGASVTGVLRSGKLPWEEQKLESEAAWKDLLKDQLRIRINGDLAAKNLPASAVKQYRGAFHPDYLDWMFARIDEFKVESYVTKVEEGKYALNDAAAIDFETSFDTAIAAKADPENPAIREGVLTVLETFDSSGNVIVAPRWDDLKKALNAYGASVNMLPRMYRYQWLRDVFELKGKELTDRLGAEFPVTAMKYPEGAFSLTRKTNLYRDFIAFIKDNSGITQPSYTYQPTYKDWYYLRGPGRLEAQRGK